MTRDPSNSSSPRNPIATGIATRLGPARAPPLPASPRGSPRAGGMQCTAPPARCPGNGLPPHRSPHCRARSRPVTVSPGPAPHGGRVPGRRRSPRNEAGAPSPGTRARCATMDPVARRLTSPTFVGRSGELGVLGSALERAAPAGRRSPSSAASRASARPACCASSRRGRARRGAHVLIGQCLELAGEQIPYAPVVGALRPLARDGTSLRGRRSRPATRNALAELLPELGGTGGRGARGGGARRPPGTPVRGAADADGAARPRRRPWCC